MTAPLLALLKTDEFHFSIGFHHTPAIVRRRLLTSPVVRHLAAALRFGAITEGMLREFIATIMSQFTKGRRLPNDLALAAVAVVLELRPTDFADEYLHDLARLRLSEMTLSILVARECLKNRCSVPKHQAKKFKFPSGERPPTELRASIQQRQVRTVSPRLVKAYSANRETA
jgi:hypothetical protein